jgi:hypothetical protein
MADHHGAESQTERDVQATTWFVIGCVLVLVFGSFAIRCSPADGRAYEARSLAPEPPPTLLVSEPDDEYFPCSDCHEDEETNPRRRELEDEHYDLELAHGDLWCLSCHDSEDRDRLHLADSAPVEFEASWRLCTQCHGDKLADWRAGVHGKRMGHWWGPKTYEPCVTCHDPHGPAFRPMAPEPPPMRPAAVRPPPFPLEDPFHATR